MGELGAGRPGDGQLAGFDVDVGDVKLLRTSRHLNAVVLASSPVRLRLPPRSKE